MSAFIDMHNGFDISDFGVDSAVTVGLSVARNNPMLSRPLLFTSFVNDGTDPGRIY